MARWVACGLGATLGWLGPALSASSYAQDVEVPETMRLENLPLSLELSACADLDHELVARLLGIELATELAGRGEPEDDTRVSARCGEDDLAEVQVDDPTTGKRSIRRVRLVATGATGRERLLALAIIELVAASWAEHHVRASADEVEHVDETASDETQERVGQIVAARMLPVPEIETEQPWLFAALFASLGASGSPAHVTLGTGAQLGIEVTSFLGLMIDLLYDAGSLETRPGDVTLRRITASGALLVRFPIRAWVPYVGLGVRGGWAILRGDRDVAGAAAVRGRVGGPILVGGTTFGKGRLMMTLGAEVGWHGWSQTGYDAPGEDAAEIAAKSGLWVGLQLGIAARLAGS